MSSVRVFDAFGNEVFWTNINSICPIEYINEAKRIAYDYFIELEKQPVKLDEMFVKLLKPIGSQEATHCWCPRGGYTHQLNMQLNRMKELSKEWIKTRVYTLEDDHNEIKSNFVVLSDDKDQILKQLGLEEI